ncbi:LCP family protein [Conexibacter sp. DBS9H8]|uniref:LCP family protein n=1 Tax=Conexibacter sp. DBS9H8 TaxID=2937801 RepID=UPI00200F2453|nr:LCP family protein [Conexibacter sp. DBS9H8]
MIVVLASAAAGAVFVLDQVNTFVADISVNKALKVSTGVLAHTSFGQPETLLLIGDDTRTVFKYYNAYVPNLANEMLMVRIDPGKPYISMMSLPRELWVNVTEPNGTTYTNRLNSAYTYGTTTLLKTIKQVTGLSVSHVVATTFTQFENAINKLGCVYSTIDERYYHNNANGGAQYQNINLLPGYQCLNGSDAEQFVSYRHTDTSQVRDARDQAFLLAVKEQYGPQLAGNISKFEKVFGETVQTDTGLRSPTEILNLANLLISASHLTVRQVHFQTTPCTTTCPPADLTATPAQIKDSVDNFLYGTDTTPRRQVAAIGHGITHHKIHGLPVTATLAANVSAEQASAAKLSFTGEYPQVQDLAGSIVPVAPSCTEYVQDCIRNYLIHAPGRRTYPAYVEVFSNGDLGQFYDVQGTTWPNPPLLRDPQQTLRTGGRTYALYYIGSHLTTVAWHQYGAVYWIHNTLLNGVSNPEMLDLAEQTRPVGPVRPQPEHATLRPFTVAVPATATGTSAIQSLGRIGGIVAIILVPLGLIVAVRDRRRLGRMRVEVAGQVSKAVVLERHLASLAVPLGPVAGRGSVTAAGRGSAARSAGLGGLRARPASRPIARSGVRRHLPRRATVVAVLVVAVVLAAAVFAALAVSGALGRRRVAPAVPTVPAVVLNAGSVTNAAHRLALALTHRRVHVIGEGNLQNDPAHGYQVLYRPGERGQAERLARMISDTHPTVMPISSGTAAAVGATAAAVGAAAQLVVVIP